MFVRLGKSVYIKGTGSKKAAEKQVCGLSFFSTNDKEIISLVPDFVNTMTYKNQTGSQDEPDRLLSGSSDDKVG